MARRPPVVYETIDWKGALMVPVRYVADGKISLLVPKIARRYYKAGTVTLLGIPEWHRIQSIKGLGLVLDTNYGG